MFFYLGKIATNNNLLFSFFFAKVCYFHEG